MLTSAAPDPTVRREILKRTGKPKYGIYRAARASPDGKHQTWPAILDSTVLIGHRHRTTPTKLSNKVGTSVMVRSRHGTISDFPMTGQSSNHTRTTANARRRGARVLVHRPRAGGCLLGQLSAAARRERMRLMVGRIPECLGRLLTKRAPRRNVHSWAEAEGDCQTTRLNSVANDP